MERRDEDGSGRSTMSSIWSAFANLDLALALVRRPQRTFIKTNDRFLAPLSQSHTPSIIWFLVSTHPPIGFFVYSPVGDSNDKLTLSHCLFPCQPSSLPTARCTCRKTTPPRAHQWDSIVIATDSGFDDETGGLGVGARPGDYDFAQPLPEPLVAEN